MPPKQRARSASRRLSPQSPSKVAPQPVRNLRTRDIHQNTTSDLPPVTESNEYQEASASPSDLEIQESAPSQAASDVSSDSQGELDALSYDLIVDSLPDLELESVKLLSYFKNTDAADLENYIRSLRDTNASSTKRFSIQFKKLIATREAFGARAWALPSILVRKLRDGQAWATITDGMWRPDAILYLANLAQLTAALCLGPKGEAALMDTFSWWPHAFSPTDPADRFTATYLQTLLDVGDDFRTQLFIHEARKRVNEPNFDPDTLLTHVFFDGDYAIRISPLVEQPQQYKSKHQDLLKQIRSTFTKSSGNPILFEKLENMFSWDRFVLYVVQWAVVREGELEALIKAQPRGAESIVEATRSNSFALAAIPVNRFHFEPPLPSTGTAKRGGGAVKRGRGGRQVSNIRGNMVALKGRKAELAQQKTTSAPATMSANLFENQENAAAAALLAYNQNHQDGEGDYAPANDDESGLPNSAQGPQSPIKLTQAEALAQGALIAGVIDQQSREANKENVATREVTKSYMDPQPGAGRVSWTPETQDALPGPSRSKRRQLTAESEADDDDVEFEEDTRQPKRARPNKGKARAIPEPSPVSDIPYAYPSTQPSYPSTQPLRSPLREQLRPPPSTAPTPLPSASQLPPGTPYTSINQLAKQNVTATRERDNRHIIQQRIPYTAQEIERLMDLIALNQGPKYAKILKDDATMAAREGGPVLQGRTQVQLKDKARNIKMDYLKARQRLPDGFANVSIGKRLVEVLRGMGIDYVEGEWMGAGTQGEVD